VQRFRGGLVFKAHRLVYHSTLGLRVIKKKKQTRQAPPLLHRPSQRASERAREKDRARQREIDRARERERERERGCERKREREIV